MSMGLRIKTLRKQAKLTQKQVADQLGMGLEFRPYRE